MKSDTVPPPSPETWRTIAALWFFRLAPGLRVPAGWFEPGMQAAQARLPARAGPLTLEVVSHCWNYSHLLAYQLSSLVLAPPTRMKVQMTVCYCHEDSDTAELLEFFRSQTVPNVTWHWLPLPRQELFRRAIGRNRAALRSTADWVWFTDCDLVFHEGCLDTLAEALSGRADALVFPREEHCTPMLAPGDALLQAAAREPRIVAIDPMRFVTQRRTKATGPLQILHGDLARQFGYCSALRCYQTPTDRWRKTYEDRAFRWLLRTDGAPVDVKGVYRIKHVEKGRYHGPDIITRIRSTIRQSQQSSQVR